MWDGFDQRKFPRINLKCEVRLNPENSAQTIVAETENVGVGGLCIIQQEELPRFSRCHIALDLEDDLPRLACEGKICWIIPKRDPKSKERKFDTGIEFVGLKEEDRERVRRFIQTRTARGFENIV